MDLAPPKKPLTQISAENVMQYLPIATRRQLAEKFKQFRKINSTLPYHLECVKLTRKSEFTFFGSYESYGIYEINIDGMKWKFRPTEDQTLTKTPGRFFWTMLQGNNAYEHAAEYYLSRPNTIINKLIIEDFGNLPFFENHPPAKICHLIVKVSWNKPFPNLRVFQKTQLGCVEIDCSRNNFSVSSAISSLRMESLKVNAYMISESFFRRPLVANKLELVEFLRNPMSCERFERFCGHILSNEELRIGSKYTETVDVERNVCWDSLKEHFGAVNGILNGSRCLVIKTLDPYIELVVTYKCVEFRRRTHIYTCELMRTNSWAAVTNSREEVMVANINAAYDTIWLTVEKTLTDATPFDFLYTLFSIFVLSHTFFFSYPVIACFVAVFLLNIFKFTCAPRLRDYFIRRVRECYHSAGHPMYRYFRLFVFNLRVSSVIVIGYGIICYFNCGLPIFGNLKWVIEWYEQYEEAHRDDGYALRTFVFMMIVNIFLVLLTAD